MKKIAFFALLSVGLAVTLVGCGGVSGSKIALFDVTGGGKTAVHQGDTINFGEAKVMFGPFTQTRTFRIENEGRATLKLTGMAPVMFSGDILNFSIPAQPPSSLPVGNSVDFDIVFTATNTTGSAVQRNATVGIRSDDPDLPLASFHVMGSDLQS